jgi:tetraprenyl-beta-curcumene synthase
LDRWEKQSGHASDDVLKEQALSSISRKKFHAQGGCAYSLYPGVQMDTAIKFIVSLQTISDYLDNLCDRTGVSDEAAFRQLHLAMTDAVSLNTTTHDYYRYYPYKNDNGYLKALVEECKKIICGLPAYNIVEETINKYAEAYSNLQIYKHLEPHLREKNLRRWIDFDLYGYEGVHWWELSAAAGSTLGIFLLFAAAHDACLNAKEVNSIEEAYFPWVCGLHILLDYFIDSEEDMAEGDLNFTSYYKNPGQCEERLAFFIKQSLSKCRELKYPELHRTIINGLLAMYLSDPKAASRTKRDTVSRLIKAGGKKASSYYHICSFLRHDGKL